MPQLSAHTKAVGDVISIATVSATLMLWLPPIASLLTVVWMVLRIYETRTIQRWLGHPRKKRTRAADKE